MAMNEPSPPSLQWTPVSPSSRRRDMFVGALLIGLWIFFFGERITSPWVQGVDPITRLFHIDKTIVTVIGNPWLPGLQILLQGVSLISDSAVAYKSLVCLIGIAGMWLFFLLLRDLFGVWVATVAFLFFFLQDQWVWVTTSIYMEGLTFLSVVAAVSCFVRGWNVAGSLFFVWATFCRPEVLLAMPAVCIVHLIWFRSFQRTVLTALLAAPVTCYYLWLKFGATLLRSPGEFSLGESLELLNRVTSYYQSSFVFQFFALLALYQIIRLAIDKTYYQRYRRQLLLTLLGLAIFYPTYLLVSPVGHQLSGGGSRFGMLLSIPVFTLAALAIGHFCKRYWPGVAMATLVVSTVLLTLRYTNIDDRAPWSFLAAWKTHQKLLEHGYMVGNLPLCILDGKRMTRPDLHPTKRMPVLLYLRFLGWKVEPIPCFENQERWKKIRKKGQDPLLLVYRPDSLEEDYLSQVSRQCRFRGRWWSKDAVIARFCF